MFNFTMVSKIKKGLFSIKSFFFTLSIFFVIFSIGGIFGDELIDSNYGYDWEYLNFSNKSINISGVSNIYIDGEYKPFGDVYNIGRSGRFVNLSGDDFYVLLDWGIVQNNGVMRDSEWILENYPNVVHNLNKNKVRNLINWGLDLNVSSIPQAVRNSVGGFYFTLHEVNGLTWDDVKLENRQGDGYEYKMLFIKDGVLNFKRAVSQGVQIDINRTHIIFNVTEAISDGFVNSRLVFENENAENLSGISADFEGFLEQGDIEIYNDSFDLFKWDEVNFSLELSNVTGDGFYWVNETFINNYSDYDVILYPTQENGFEFEIVLQDIPENNSFYFPINSSGLEFYFQGRLDDEENNYTHCNATDCWGEEIIHRPENIVNSYAVYHSYKVHNQYMTGKAFHIYRIEVFDSNGHSTFGELNISDGIMNISINESFLKRANYPIVIDPSFGYTTVGGTQDSSYNRAMAGRNDLYLADGTETVTELHIYTSSDGGSVFAMGVYDYDDINDYADNLIFKEATEFDTGGEYTWLGITGLSYDNLTEGANHTLAFGDYSGATIGIAYDTFTNGLCRQDDGTLDDPWGLCDSNKDRRVSIYANYTLSAGNTAPTHNIPIFSPSSPHVDQNFTCLNQSTADTDGDNVTNVFNWLVNGSDIAIINLPMNQNVSNVSKDLIRDYSNNGNNGTLGNESSSQAPEWVANCKVGGCYDFQGNGNETYDDDFINMDEESMFNVSSNFTIMFWMYNDDYAGTIGNYVGKSGHYLIRYHNSSEELQFYTYGGINDTHINTSLPATEQWVHVAFTYDNVTKSIYIDGSLNKSEPANGDVYNIQADRDFCIGAQCYTSWGRYGINGKMDEFKYLNRSLSANQIYQIYLDENNSGMNSTIVSDETLLGDNWTCQVTPNDETEDGLTKQNSTLIRENDPPNINVLSPTNQTYAPGAVFFNATADDTISTWIVNYNGTNFTHTINTTMNVVYGSHYHLYLYANDSDGNWGVNSSTFFHVSTAPTHDVPIFSPTDPTTSQNFTCLNQSTVDSDSDNVTNVYNWLVNGTSFAVVNIPFEMDMLDNSSKGIRDYTDNGHNGSCSGSTCPTWTSDGKVGGALEFDGSEVANNYITLADSDGLDLINNLTLEAWINLDNNSGDFGVIGKWDENTGYALTVGSSSAGQADFSIGATTISSSALSLNQWYHLVGTWDGTTARLYVNGSQVSSDTPLSIGTNAVSIHIGENAGAIGTNFNGTIDEVKIYNRTLTAMQVYQNYFQGWNNYSNSTIVSDETINGDNWTCQITPNDELVDGTTKQNSTLISSISTYDRDITQSFTITNIVNRLVSFFRDNIVSTTISDTLTRLFSPIRGVTQDMTIGDIINRLFFGVFGLTQSFTINDNLVRKTDLNREQTQSITINSLVSELYEDIGVLYTRLNVQEVSFNEVVDRFLIRIRTQNQGMTFSDLINRLFVGFKTTSQEVSFNDVVLRSHRSSVTTTQIFSFNSVINRFRGINREVSQTISIDMVVERMGDLSRVLSQIINLIVKMVTSEDAVSPTPSPGVESGIWGLEECFLMDDDYSCFLEYYYQKCPLKSFESLEACEEYANAKDKIPRDINRYLDYLGKLIAPENKEKGKFVSIILILLILCLSEVIMLIKLLKERKIKEKW